MWSSVIFSTVYKGNLKAKLIAPSVKLPFKSIYDLADYDGGLTIYMAKHTIIHNFVEVGRFYFKEQREIWRMTLQFIAFHCLFDKVRIVSNSSDKHFCWTDRIFSLPNIVIWSETLLTSKSCKTSMKGRIFQQSPCRCYIHLINYYLSWISSSYPDTDV